ncbi:MAG: TonB-dependent receptor [Dysgonamonadaceae bacterium]|jgi:TonB-linked SusC/RagA family outer membrane protein|nr:TonB-dependent receptor [Dysgonamonadaceae bacterium]
MINEKTKFCLVGLWLLFGLLHHGNIAAQDEVKKSVTMKQVSVDELVKKLGEEFPYSFFIADQSASEVLVSVDVKNATVEQVLAQAFSGKNLSFTKKNKSITITFKEGQLPVYKTFNGVVHDSSGEAVIGASVIQKGTTNGTITDLEGKFSLSVPAGSILSVSYIGYVPAEIKVSNQANLQITLAEDTKLLDEVVVVGYGTQKKSDLTGAVSSIKTEDIPITSDASIGQLIKGKAAGVTALSTSAQPGGGVDILVRGAASVGAGNEPLFVIDGFPVSNAVMEPGNGTQYSSGSRSPLNSLNPNDIESLEILKDASATAIYGSRAANGVILITTKRGKDGLKLNYDGSFTTQVIDKPFEVFNARDYMIESNRMIRQKWMRDNKLYPFGTTAPSSIPDFNANRYTEEQIIGVGVGTNWWNEVMQQGFVNNHNISITYGNDKIRTYASFGYFKHDGVVKGSAMERFSTKINLDYTINRYIQAGMSYMGAIINNDNIQGGDAEWEGTTMIMSALLFDPSLPVRDEEGNYSEMSWYTQMPNPVSYQEVNDKTKQTRNMTSLYLQIEPLKNLQIRSSVGYDGQGSVRKNYFPKTFRLGKNKDGQAQIAQMNREDLLFNTVATYNFEYLKNRFTVMAGYEYQEFNADNYSLGASGFFTDAFLYNNIGAGDREQYAIGSYKGINRMASYFGRILYNLLDRYLLTVNMRYDGSDKFGANKKWAFFPSASVGWRVSEEAFVKQIEQLSNLKLRVGYGQTGNSNIGSNALAFYDANRTYAFNNILSPGAMLTQIANPNLTWETTTELNLGMDFGLFNSRITGAVEYFDKTISSILGSRNLRSWMVVPSVAANLGKTQSKGVEITLNTVNILTKNFKWTTDFTYTLYRDRWKERSPDVVLSPWQSVDDPIRSIFYWKTDGILQIGEEVPHMPTAVPGNMKVQDINGFDENMNYTGHPDGKIDYADVVLLGTSDPGYSIGFNNTFRYKDFDLNIYAYGVFNQLVFNGIKQKYITYASHMHDYGYNLWVEAAKRWSTDNPNGIYPSEAINVYQGNDSWLYEDATFFRIKNITLGYNFPVKYLPKEIGKIRVYADCQNPVVFTKWMGMDPEIAGSHKAPYPNQRSYAIGLNIQF